MEGAAQGGTGVTVSESIQETFRCFSGRNIGGRGMVGLDDLSGLFQPR